jgi:hypothetical protein
MCFLEEESNLSSVPANSKNTNRQQHSNMANSRYPRKVSATLEPLSSSIGISKSNYGNKNVYSSSYGSSFSEHVGIVGNQIQIIQEDSNVAYEPNNLSSNRNEFNYDFSPTGKNKFVLKFSETNLKELA